MASKKACADDIDYHYYKKIIAKLFPHHNYDPTLLAKPTTKFVLDFMELVVNYFYKFSKKMPKFKDPLESNETENEHIHQAQAPQDRWQLLQMCNEILHRVYDSSESDFAETFYVGDVVCPNKHTVTKIGIMLTICLHLHDMDFTEQFDYIQKILNQRASLLDYEQLKEKKLNLEVASACLQHKFDNLKSKEELQCMRNSLLAETAKFEERKIHLKKEEDNMKLLLNQRKNEQKIYLDLTKEMEEKLIDEKQVEALKLKLQTLQLTKKNLVTEGENLTNKSNNTRLTKQLLEFQLKKLADSNEILMQEENYRKVEVDLTTKLENNLRVNADLFKQIETSRKEIKLYKDDTEVVDWNAKFKINKAKIQSDIVLEDKKLEKLRSDAKKTAAKVEILLTDIETKSTECEQLTTNIQNVDKKVKEVMDTMLLNTLKKC